MKQISRQRRVKGKANLSDRYICWSPSTRIPFRKSCLYGCSSPFPSLPTLEMPYIQSSLLPLVKKWAPLLSESDGLYPYFQEGDVRNGVPLHLTLEDHQLGYNPLAWISKDYDEAWSTGWTRTSKCPFTRHENENSGTACWYINQDVLDQGSEGIYEKMKHAYLHLVRKGLVPDRRELLYI